MEVVTTPLTRFGQVLIEIQRVDTTQRSIWVSKRFVQMYEGDIY